MPGIFGCRVYNEPKFKALMNKNYESVSEMRKSIKMLKAAGLDLVTMRWGDYQTILSPIDKWPGPAGPMWAKSLQDARDGLAKRPNTLPLSKDDPTVFPNQCALADAAVRKCFNSEPPIPMTIDVTEQLQDSSMADQHDIKLEWTYETSGAPTHLKFIMICPFRREDE